ncbi:MAG TPA: hypothetical protein VGC03_03740 [Acidimicrobiia bacterium]
MIDRLDREIRSMVVELIEASPAPHPAHKALRSKSGPAAPLSLRSGLVRMLAGAAVVLVVGLAGVWVGRNLVPVDTAEIPIVKGGETELTGAPQDLTELDESHPAIRLPAQGATDRESFAEAASEQELQFVCAAGGEDPSWELCLVAHEGVLAVVPFESIEGLVARVTDSDLTQDVLVPLDTDRPIGIRNTGPLASVDIEYVDGTVVGSMSAPWSPSREGS